MNKPYCTREAFAGGEEYRCIDCGALIERLYYPVGETRTSAERAGLVSVERHEACTCADVKSA